MYANILLKNDNSNPLFAVYISLMLGLNSLLKECHIRSPAADACGVDDERVFKNCRIIASAVFDSETFFVFLPHTRLLVKAIEFFLPNSVCGI